MPGKRKKTMEIREMLRRLCKGQSDRAIGKAMGMDRKTVGRYRAWAMEQGLMEGDLPARLKAIADIPLLELSEKAVVLAEKTATFPARGNPGGAVRARIKAQAVCLNQNHHIPLERAEKILADLYSHFPGNGLDRQPFLSTLAATPSRPARLSSHKRGL